MNFMKWDLARLWSGGVFCIPISDTAVL